jgi:oligopeptide transport system substrate-binding protein
MLFGVLAVMAIGVVAVACGDDDDSAPTKTAAPSGSATSAPAASPTAQANLPKKGGSIIIHYLAPESFDPHQANHASDIGPDTMVFRGAYKYDKSNKPVPEYADGQPTVNAAGTEYRVKIKSGLKWSDGSPMTAKDFAAGILRTCHADVASEYQFVLSSVVGCDDLYAATKETPEKKAELLAKVGVKVIDDTTYTVTLLQPQATFPMILAMWVGAALPTSIIKNPGDPWPAWDKLIYNGPYKITGYTEKDSLTLERNEHYALSATGHAAYLDKITLKYIESSETANNAYRNGELQMALANTTQLDVIKSSLAKDYFPGPQSANTIGIHMNLKKAPLDNFNVRLALSRATDRVTLNKVVLKEAHIPSTSWIPGEVVGESDKKYDGIIGFDVAAAKKALADAGFPDGKGFPKLSFLIRDNPATKATVEFLQAEWKKHLGIDVGVEVVDTPTRTKRYNSKDFELYIGGWNQDFPDPENWVDGLYNSTGVGNKYSCNDPVLDQLFIQAKVNKNDEERRGQYKKINEIISAKICGTAVIYHSGAHFLVSPKLKGVRENSTSQDRVQAGDWIPEEWSLE